MKTKAIIMFGVFLFVLIATPAFAGMVGITRYVNCEYGSPNYETIQYAVNASGPWDTIIVCPPDDPCYGPVLITGNKDGLTIMSQEIPDCGPNTCVSSFTIGFAPHSDHPEHVTIKGFNITPCKLNGVGIESSTNYNTIAFNHVYGCEEGEGTGAGGAIRVNEGNVGNNLHHNLIDDCALITSGIRLEVNGSDHNVHQNCVEGCGDSATPNDKGIWVQSDFCQIHQNQILDYVNFGIVINGSADDNQVHHNEVCDGTSSSINLGSSTTGNFIHHNILTGVVNGSTGGDRIRMNDTNAYCPFDELGCCNGDAVDGMM